MRWGNTLPVHCNYCGRIITGEDCCNRTMLKRVRVMEKELKLLRTQVKKGG